MKIRMIIMLALVIVLGAVQSVSASIILPNSSYLDNSWHGSSYYNDDGFDLRVDFAVYDTSNLAMTGEQSLANLVSIDSDYIYAYQVFNLDSAAKEIGEFNVMTFGGESIEQSAMSSTGAFDDYTDGVAPRESSPEEGVWQFEEGTLVAGEHSWLLVFGSDSKPIAGDYEVKELAPDAELPVPDDDGNLPVPEVPEPATMALLSVGGLALVRKRANRIGK